MTTDMNRYNHTKIYKLEHPDGWYYIGSTTQPLYKRLYEHKLCAKSNKAKPVHHKFNELGWDEVREVVSDYALRQVTHTPPPSLSEPVTSMGWAFASNAVVLYLMNKFRLDTMIVKPEASPATRAAELAILFVLVNEVTHFALQHWWSGLLKYLLLAS